MCVRTGHEEHGAEDEGVEAVLTTWRAEEVADGGKHADLDEQTEAEQRLTGLVPTCRHAQLHIGTELQSTAVSS